MVFVFNETLKNLLNSIVFKNLNCISGVLIFDNFQNISWIVQVRDFILHTKTSTFFEITPSCSVKNARIRLFEGCPEIQVKIWSRRGSFLSHE